MKAILSAKDKEIERLRRVSESMESDAMRFRWIIEGNGYWMEENELCGHWMRNLRDFTEEMRQAERDKVRRMIDEEMRARLERIYKGET